MIPPRLPRWVMSRLSPREDRDIIVGDLDEEFRQRARQGRSASAWYWQETLASMPAALRLRWQRAGLTRDIGGDCRRAIRLLWRRPGFAAAALVALAFGAGITTAVASICEAILVRPLPYANGDRIVYLREHDPTRQGPNLSWADFDELASSLRSFAAVGAFSDGSRTLSGLGPSERLRAIEITPSLFAVLGVVPALGRTFSDADGVGGAPGVVILSHTAWRRRFGGDPAAVGRTVVLSGAPFTIVGVLPASFAFAPRANPELWLPLRPSQAQLTRGDVHSLDVLALRRAEVTAAAAAEELRVRADRWQHSGAAWHASTTLQTLGLRDEMVAGVRPSLMLLLGAAVLVMLAAAVSVSGLVLARAAARAREMQLRAALGAGRWRIIRQLGIEALTIAVPGAALGLILASCTVAFFDATTRIPFRDTLPFADRFTLSPLAAAASVTSTMIAVLVAGLIPVLRGRRPGTPFTTGARATAGHAETRLRGVVVAAQIALAVVLLAGAALVGRSVVNLSRVYPGFAIDGLLTGRLSLPDTPRYQSREGMVQAVDRVLERVRAVRGVSSAEAINRLPLGGRSYTSDFRIVGRGEQTKVDALIRNVTPGYLAAMGIPLLAGRAIEPTDTGSAERVVVVNAMLARLAFGGRSPIGERLVLEFLGGKPAWTIVGVAGDEQFDTLDKPMAPVVYVPFAQNPVPAFSLVMRTAAPEAVVTPVRAAITDVDPALPLYGVQTLAASVASSNAVFLRTLVMRLLVWFSVAALLLGGVGVYGVLAEAVTARTREIGIRLALGATGADVARLALRIGLAPAALGGVCGFILAAIAAPSARTLLFGVAPLDLRSLAAVALVVAAVALAACALPARRAARLPAVAALRHE
ncbi:MAG TPA: ADOP family duplicated permease [Vicinamibacterales bacterium]|nr:ADOP family duplicated permease [Vicinamibacterales bacterium]